MTPRKPTDDHPYYNVQQFPIYIGRPDHSNWEIYANERGKLASIAVEPGAQSTHYGDARHLRRLFDACPTWNWELTLAGWRMICLLKRSRPK